MWWGNPSALWWLAAVPLVVLLYWLRPRRVRVVVPSVLLWRRSLREQLRRRPFRRFEGSWLLVLQVLAVAAASMALARPQRPAPAGGDAVAVVDVGVTLEATDVRPSRFEAARTAAAAFLSTVPAARVGVVAAARAPRWVQPLTPDRSEALRALRALQPTDGPSDLQAAVDAARSSSPAAEVRVFSDRALPGVASSVFGGTLEDVAITGVVSSPEGQDRMRVTVSLRNGTGRARALEAVVLVEGQVQARVPLRLAAGEEGSVQATVPAGTWVEARVSAGDVLPATDRYFALGTRLPGPRVLVVGPPEPFLERALRVVAGSVQHDRTPAPEAWPRFDVVVLHRVSASSLPPGNYFLVASLAGSLPARAAGQTADTVVWQARTHPVLRFAELTGVRAERALALEVAGGEVLAAGRLPLLWAYETPSLRAVLLAFSPSDSDLAQRPGFPILVANVLQYLASPTSSQVEAGSVVWAPAGGSREALVRGPAGAWRVRARGGRFWLPPFDRAGVYVLEAPGVRRLWAVHPSSGEVRGPQVPAVPEGSGQPAADWGRWLVAVFGGLLVAEWWLFSSRNSGGGGQCGSRGPGR